MKQEVGRRDALLAERAQLIAELAELDRVLAKLATKSTSEVASNGRQQRRMGRARPQQRAS